MEQYRLQFPNDLDDRQFPVVHLAYWHTRLLSDLFSSAWRAQFALQDCGQIVRLLTSNSQLLTPLNHHFVSLVSLALLELVKGEDTRDEARKLIKDILEYSIAPSPWNGAAREKLAETLRLLTKDGADGGMNAKNLQQLADLAAAADGSLPAAAAAVSSGPPASAPDPAPMPTPTSIPGPVSSGEAAKEDGPSVPAIPDPRPFLKAGYLVMAA